MLVKEGQFVVVEFEDSFHVIQATSSSKVKLKKGTTLKGDQLISQKFSTHLTISDGNIEVAAQTHKSFADNYIQQHSKFGDGSTVIDNPNKIETNIGSTDVASIVENSLSFDQKTRYSQYKYIVKKLKKHNPIFILHHPTSFNLCRFYYTKQPDKICFIRYDRMAQLLYFASINHESKVAVFENTQGLVVGSVLERLESGTVTQFYYGNVPENKVVKMMKIDVRPVFVNIMNVETVTETFDALIIVAKFNVLEIVKELLKFLRPSASVVIYSYISEPLVEVYEYFRSMGIGWDVYISESWLRKMKVQEESTHPDVIMDDRSGFLFRAIYINK